MNNIKFRESNYHLLASRQLTARPTQYSNDNRLRYTSYQSAFVLYKNMKNRKQNYFRNPLKREQQPLHLSNMNIGRRQDKQFTDKDGLPAFKSSNKILKYNQIKSVTKSSNSDQMRLLHPNQDQLNPSHLKRYWERYLNEEIAHVDLARQLNRNFISEYKRKKYNYSESKKISVADELNKNKIEKSAFYVNNFIKTRYRQRRTECLNVEKVDELNTQQGCKIIDAGKTNIKKIEKQVQQVFNNKNWEMVPWQKQNDNEEDYFNRN